MIKAKLCSANANRRGKVWFICFDCPYLSETILEPGKPRAGCSAISLFLALAGLTSPRYDSLPRSGYGPQITRAGRGLRNRPLTKGYPSS